MAGPSILHAGRGYDSDHNCQILFEMGITPNIEQRRGSVNRGKPYRSMAAKIFDEGEYHQRGMIEGIFGGEEYKRHRLHGRFIRPDNRRRFGKIRAIAWNIKVLNRFRCARLQRIEIPSHGTASCAWPCWPGCSADKKTAEYMRKRDQMELRNNPDAGRNFVFYPPFKLLLGNENRIL